MRHREFRITACVCADARFANGEKDFRLLLNQISGDLKGTEILERN